MYRDRIPSGRYTEEEYIEKKEQENKELSAFAQAKLEYLLGTNEEGELHFPTIHELAEKYVLVYTQLMRYKRNDKEDWDLMRKEVISKTSKLAIRKLMLGNVEKLEDVYKQLFERFVPAIEDGFDRIDNGELKYETMNELHDGIKLAMNIKEKSAGRNPNEQYGQTIAEIWKFSINKKKQASLQTLTYTNQELTNQDGLNILDMDHTIVNEDSMSQLLDSK